MHGLHFSILFLDSKGDVRERERERKIDYHWLNCYVITIFPREEKNLYPECVESARGRLKSDTEIYRFSQSRNIYFLCLTNKPSPLKPWKHFFFSRVVKVLKLNIFNPFKLLVSSFPVLPLCVSWVGGCMRLWICVWRSEITHWTWSSLMTRFPTIRQIFLLSLPPRRDYRSEKITRTCFVCFFNVSPGDLNSGPYTWAVDASLTQAWAVDASLT